jgi:hypothetical protein
MLRTLLALLRLVGAPVPASQAMRRRSPAPGKCYIEEELYKDAFISLLTFFETLVKRNALRKSKQVYNEAADLLAQAGAGSHDQMRQVWRQLLRQIDGDSLKDYQLQEVRQYVYRHWNTPAARPPLRR